MGSYPVEVASILDEYLGPFVRQAGLGQVDRRDPLPDRCRGRSTGPDVAFVSHAKWPIERRTPRPQPWEIVPDLAVEVVSATDGPRTSWSKIRDYFEAGVRAVWLVYPSLEVIHVYESFTPIRVLTRDDVLDGGELVPGFRLPLRRCSRARPTRSEAPRPRPI